MQRVGSALVPEQYADIFKTMNERVVDFFSKQTTADDDEAQISISDESFLLVRANSLTNAFVRTVQQQHMDPQEATLAANTMLFDFAYSIGSADASMISQRLNLTSPYEKLACGPLYFARCGWAKVAILPLSNLELGPSFVLHAVHESAESKSVRGITAASCAMNAGYAAGWTSSSFNTSLGVSEVLCCGRGDDVCHFIVAPVEHVAEHVDAFFDRADPRRMVPVFQFYGRQRMLQELAERERQYWDIFEGSSDALMLIDADGILRRINGAACQMLGGTSTELTGVSLESFGISLDAEQVRAITTPVTPPIGASKPDEKRKANGSENGEGALAHEGAPLNPPAPGKTPVKMWVETVARRLDGTVFDVDVSMSAFRHGPRSLVLLTVRDVTVAKEAQRQLQRASAAAEEASRMKCDFLAMFSHEVRTPMNGVIGMTSVLLSTDLTPSQRRSLEVVQHSAQSLLDLLSTVLDVSQMEAGKLELQHTDFNMTSLVHDTADLYRPQAQRKRLDLRTTISRNIPHRITGDPIRIRQVLANLLQNSIKFTNNGSIDIVVEIFDARPKLDGLLVEDAGEMVAASLKRRHDSDEAPPAAETADDEDTRWLRFTVRDTGVGVSKSDLAAIFRPYEQGSSKGRNSSLMKGTGLGLSICKSVVQLMGGQISIASEERKYTAIQFSAKVSIPVRRPIDMRERLCVLITEESCENKDAQGKLELQLEGLNFRVMTCYSIMQGEDALGSSFPSVLVIDVADPSQAIAAARSSIKFSTTPIVCVTHPKFHDRLRARSIRSVEAPASAEALAQAIIAVVAVEQQPSAADGAASTESPRKRRVQRPRILVVEDHVLNQETMTRMLQRLSCQVDIAQDGKEAVEKSEKGNYDLIFMDYSLPVMDGLEATRIIRARESFSGKNTPIISLTGDTFEATKQRCIEAGVNAVLFKPVQLNELERTLNDYLSE